ncbi:MAG: class I SAM-dependent methyltransferase [Bacteroidetes bacterium]|nr:class I SAM-dependent methyltransferase [Bacteroidota bacterium]
MEKRNCPICDGKKNQKLFHQSFSGFSDTNLLDSYDVVACNNCGFCYADNIPDQKKFDVYYRELSKYESNTVEVKEGYYDRLRFEAMVKYLKPFLPDTHMHIVEVGCATGFLLSMFKKEGYLNLTGIDPSPGCTSAAKRHYGINVLTNTISNIELPNGSIDMLILVGVLEHIKDLDESLEKLWKLLTPDGHIFIGVPDGSQYFNGQDAPFQEFSVEHINFFGPGSLDNLMKKNKFSKVDISQVPLNVNHNTVTPAILSVFRKELAADTNFVMDKESPKNIAAYVEMCHAKEKEINAIIEKIGGENESIIVWGTGAQTLRLLVNSKLRDVKISAFVDSNPKYQGKSLNGVNVISPESLKSKTDTILISTRPYQNEIESQIRNTLGLTNKVIKLY